LGLWMVGTRVDLEPGARLAAAYGVAALLGWMTNLVVGISYKLFPGFVAAARSESGRGAVPIASLGVPQRAQAPIFLLVNAGLGARRRRVHYSIGGQRQRDGRRPRLCRAHRASPRLHARRSRPIARPACSPALTGSPPPRSPAGSVRESIGAARSLALAVERC